MICRERRTPSARTGRLARISRGGREIAEWPVLVLVLALVLVLVLVLVLALVLVLVLVLLKRTWSAARRPRLLARRRLCPECHGQWAPTTVAVGPDKCFIYCLLELNILQVLYEFQ